MTARERLPDRRLHDGFEFQLNGIGYHCGVGRYRDGRPAEVFLTTAKIGTAADTAARDSAIAASLALQAGIPFQTLRRALTRNGDGSAGGPLAAALDLVARELGDK